MGDLETWSTMLLRPLLDGMVTMINENQDMLEKARTWKGIQKILPVAPAKQLLEGETPNVENKHKFYKALKQLSDAAWFEENDYIGLSIIPEQFDCLKRGGNFKCEIDKAKATKAKKGSDLAKKGKKGKKRAPVTCICNDDHQIELTLKEKGQI